MNTSVQEGRGPEQHSQHGVEGRALHRAEAFVAMRRSEDRCQAVTTHHATGMTTGPSQIQPVGCGTWGNHPCRDEYENVLDIPCHMEILVLEVRCDASDLSINELGRMTPFGQRRQ